MEATAPTTDAVQHRLADYARRLSFEDLTPEAIHAAKVRLIDTLGALLGGFKGEASSIARRIAMKSGDPSGATIVGTRSKVRPDMAAFANAVAARDAEVNDSYHWPGSAYGHPSDAIFPVVALAEHAGASGKDLITAIVLTYEIFLRISDVFPNPGFDPTNFGSIAVAASGARLLGLSFPEIAGAISMATVSGNMLKQVRTQPLSMWKSVASGEAGRAGVFAALMAQEGMQAPFLPFEGKAGWCDYVARAKINIQEMGGAGVPFKILSTRTKRKPASGEAISAILAAERIAPLKDIDQVDRVLVETYKKSILVTSTGDHQWNPQSREEADHSVPYLVSAALTDGRITPASFNDAHLADERLRALIRKVQVIEDAEFTAAYGKKPIEHRTRIIVTLKDGKTIVGQSGGSEEDEGQMNDASIAEKFNSLSEALLGKERAKGVLSALWSLEKVEKVGQAVETWAGAAF